MVKKTTKRPRLSYPTDLVGAVRDVATAIREHKQRVPRRRFEIGSKLMSLANITAGVLLLEQGLRGFPYVDVRLLMFGLLVVVWLYSWGMALTKGGEET